MKIQTVPGKQYSSFALITAQQGPQKLYLLQWNSKWQVFNLIGGKLDNQKGDDNSPARTIYRELEEELGLQREEECLIINLIKHVELRQFSYREQKEKEYHFSIFEVDLFPRLQLDQSTKISAARWLSTGRENVFVTKSEIENLTTISGRPISATTRQILRQLGELPRPQTGLISLNHAHKAVPTATNDKFLDSEEMLMLRLERTENALKTLIAHSQINLTQSPPMALEEENIAAYYHRLMQRIPALVCELTPDGTVLFINNAIQPLTGYKPADIIGHNWWRIFYPDQEGYQVNQLYRLLRQGDVQDHEMALKTRDGRTIPVRWTTTNQYDGHGQLQRIIGFGIERVQIVIEGLETAVSAKQLIT